MEVLLLTRSGVRNVTIKSNLSKTSKDEILTLESINATLNDARVIAVTFLSDIEERQTLNTSAAIRQLQRALACYETLIRVICGQTQRGYLRYFYKEVERSAKFEMQEVKSMFESILTTDNDKFQQHYQRYLSSIT